jgi:clan AA aspartic protease (TIGR02281 family)
MRELIEIVFLLFQLYVALGLMAVGFGFMLAGKTGGGQVARYYFGRSARWLLLQLRFLTAAVLTTIWQLLIDHVLHPLARHLQRALAWWFASRRRITLTLALAVLGVMTMVALASPALAQTVSISARNKMFHSEVVINEQLKAHALIDTGASFLSLCATAARTLGLQLGQAIVLHTANGTITARRATVRSLRIGAIVVHDIAAVVKSDATPCAHEPVLVGMSVLSQLLVTLARNRMVLVAGQQPNKPVGSVLHWLWLGAAWGVTVAMALTMPSA